MTPGGLGEARAGTLAWKGAHATTDLATVEQRLFQAAERSGVHLHFGDAVTQIRSANDAWTLQTETLSRFHGDLLIDASGVQRASLDLMGGQAPDVYLDEIHSPERHLSWSGQAAAGDPVLIAWASAPLEGLLQVQADGRARLTVRGGVGDGCDLTAVLCALHAAGGPSLSDRLNNLKLDPRASLYISAGPRRVALEEARTEGLAPLVLIGDALLEVPPRYGEGISQALDQARQLGRHLKRGQIEGLGAALAEHAKAHWAGYGIAQSIRSPGNALA